MSKITLTETNPNLTQIPQSIELDPLLGITLMNGTAIFQLNNTGNFTISASTGGLAYEDGSFAVLDQGQDPVFLVKNDGSVGFFGVTPAAQQVLGPATAGNNYGNNERDMLQRVYNAIRAFGLGT